jgi:alpha-amylase
MSNRAPRTLCLLAIVFVCAASSAFAQSGSTTRIEQDNPTITYSGNWYSNESPLHSGGVAALTNAPGARVTLSFTGTGITWVGVVDGYSGLATAYVDGTMKIVDSYANPAAYQHAVYGVRGLNAGPHTLTIEVTHERAGKTEGSWVWIDAFDIENGQPVPGGIAASSGHVEENNPALIFTGRWYGHSGPDHNGGGAVLATDTGSRATITFNGTGVSWSGFRDEWSGVARVYVDNELKATIDTYLSPSQAHTVPYSIDGLASGTHSMTIEATGTRNQSSKGSWIWLDSFDVVVR